MAMNRPELLSPAGGFEAACAAFQYGADAVYLGLPRFSARAEADSLTPQRLRILLAYARSFTPAKKVYITFNTLVQDTELAAACDMLDELDRLGPDGVIVQDLGIARLIREQFPRLTLHASTQLAAQSLEGVLALKDLGFVRVVLARELSLDEIRNIVAKSGVEIEIFVHGALCYSYSGLCLFSSHTTGRSGNRGRCAYCCRESFSSPDMSATPSRHPFSMKDLALAPTLKQVAETGAHSLKIEGRMKSPLYVACVTDYYRHTLDARYTPAEEKAMIQDLQTIFSRPWTSLYAHDLHAAPDTLIDPGAVGHRGTCIGKIDTLVNDREGRRWIRFTTSRALEKHDGLQIELPSGGRPFGFPVDLLRTPGSRKTAISLPTGSIVEVALPMEEKPFIPPGSPIFCSASQAVRRRYEIRSIRESEWPSGPQVDVTISLAPDTITVIASAPPVWNEALCVQMTVPATLAPARQAAQTEAAVRKAFERLGQSEWSPGRITLDDPHALFVPLSKLHELRRGILDALTAQERVIRERHKAAILASVALDATTPCQVPAATPHWTLKYRINAPFPAPHALTGFDTFVLAIEHLSFPQLMPLLAQWKEHVSGKPIRLALPLITRASEASALTDTCDALIRNGWRDWECADLAGDHLLRSRAVTPASSDWSLYAMNRMAVVELERLGIRLFVPSPECSAETLCALSGHFPEMELLAWQQTPLFISETPPAVGLARNGGCTVFTDRRGQRFQTWQRDNRWITTLESPYAMAGHLHDLPCHRFRLDASWSAHLPDLASLFTAFQQNRPLPGTHTANLFRGLA